MSKPREHAVALAKQMGLCTQCLKHKAAPHRFQCQHCIDMNRNKRKKRDKEYDKTYIQRRREKAEREGLCNRCAKNKSKEGHKLCEACLDYFKRRDNRMGVNRNKGKPLSEEHRRKIVEGLRRRKMLDKGREKAFAKLDKGLDEPKRSYTRKETISPLIKQRLIIELEQFISELPLMTAQDYLKKREQLIVKILRKGE